MPPIKRFGFLEYGVYNRFRLFLLLITNIIPSYPPTFVLDFSIQQFQLPFIQIGTEIPQLYYSNRKVVHHSKRVRLFKDGRQPSFILRDQLLGVSQSTTSSHIYINSPGLKLR